MTELDKTLQRLVVELRKSAIALRESVKLLERAEEAEVGDGRWAPARKADKSGANRPPTGRPARS